MSFDPSKLICFSCDNEHPVISKKPAVILFSDQNFVPTLNCKNGNCINIVRAEDASLLELLDMAIELFGDVTFPEGSIFMFGFASHLCRNGTSLYAMVWTQLVAATSSRWQGIHICPLIPLIASECPGPIVRDISEISMWFDTVYDSDPQGPHEAWMGVIAAMEDSSTGAITLEVMESYKLALPSTLQCKAINSTITFCSNNSRPVTYNGLSKDRCRELLGFCSTVCMLASELALAWRSTLKGQMEKNINPRIQLERKLC